ncbi:MAG: DUF4190 domain-containing protein [Nanoarchaeota archaeon]
MVKEELKNKDGFEDRVYYTLGILSILLAFFNPVASLISGILGFNYSRKSKDYLQKKTKKFSIVGITLSVIMIIFYVGIQVILQTQGIF